MKIIVSLRCLLLPAFLFFCTTIFGQSNDITQSNWTSQPLALLSSAQGLPTQINANKADYYAIDFQAIYSQLLVANDGLLIELPVGDGVFASFSIHKNTTMAGGLMEAYPGIRSFNIVSTDSRSTWGKMDVSHNGFRAMIFRPGHSTLFIDPVFHNETEAYIVYQKSDFVTDKWVDCQVDSHGAENDAEFAKAGLPYNTCELNTYRLALSATGEYTAFHGGDQADAIAAQITTMNRVSGVYERDFSVTFTIIENNDLIVYTDASTDPFTNGNPGAMIGENQTNTNSVIGAANYDIGHVFGTNSGGLAGLGVTCSNNQKARGVTGSGAPINDPFDIDYVAHEMGHQFGGNHSFNNSCNGNRNNGTAVEPGSGSTIMAYAGICSPNVQNNSDDHFHGINMREIGLQISNDNCQVVTELDNSPPELADLPVNFFIPINTPFALTAVATDPDGDELTYCWEQMDNELNGDVSPEPTAVDGPAFRSFSPDLNPTRYFPNTSNGLSSTWEVLTQVERSYSFRVSVRDNAPGGSCTQYDDMEVITIPEAGPFLVEYPNTFGIEWSAYASETVLWDVANTTIAPLNAAFVDIFLSIDGGDNYDIQLADDVANDGAHAVDVPNIDTDDARIRVMNSDGTFFDVSNNDFTIISVENGFYFESGFTGIEICQDQEVEFFVEIVEIGSFPEQIALEVTEQPTNSVASLSADATVVGDVINVIVSDFEGTAPGVYTLTLTGSASDFENAISFEIAVIDINPDAAEPLLPENEVTGIETTTTLSWEDNATVGMTYGLELALDENFSDMVLMEIGLEEAMLEVSDLQSETTYFWRVSNLTDCGNSQPSPVFQFTTFTCGIDASVDVPLDIPADVPGGIESTLEITSVGIIAEVSVLDIVGTHSQMSDLTFIIESPTGTEVVLATSTCGLNLTLESNGDVVVSNPAVIAGTYESSGAADFGGNIPSSGLNGILVQALDDSANPEELCESAINDAELNGKIALINRGNCPFVDKVLNAQSAGAIAVIIANNIPGDGFFDMGGTSNAIDIPAIMISYEDGEILREELGGNAEGFSFGFDDLADSAEIPCPATDGGVYQPMEPLGVLSGETAAGTWKLKVYDSSSENGGELTGWNLQICYTDDIVDGIAENVQIQAKVFPNPARDLITVQLEADVAKKISLLDIAGRIIETRIPVSRQTQFDLSSLADGVYLIKIEGPDFGQSVHKIIKQ